jgi:hypothetical protein
MAKEVKKKIVRNCALAVCNREMKVTVYKDGSYRGGHYFGKIGVHTKAEMRKARRAGTHDWDMGNGHIVQVMNKDPKPYKYVEYRECPRCYWRPWEIPKEPRPAR